VSNKRGVFIMNGWARSLRPFANWGRLDGRMGLQTKGWKAHGVSGLLEVTNLEG
jgi:hypothetical protein